ncbi:RNA polymerase sigma-70 factor, ECF subfamily [Flavobacteriaceae bacterium MAR_2010_188]|nr:RNA polymerase sigma-70 factor, ECF subfamily [Flavobacteriaceae bacterium MAR_2010_188]
MILTDQNTEQLLNLCDSGNQQAQMEIYNRYYKAMYNTSLRIVRDSFEAEDIMQESFLTAFSKLSTLNEKATFGAWLKRIVINNSIQYYKKNKAKKEESLDNKIYKLKIADEVYEESNHTNQKAKMVLECMKDLKSNYRTGLTLHLIEGYDYEEICEIMEISYANCRTMISRAKESLRKNLQPLEKSLYEG